MTACIAAAGLAVLALVALHRIRLLAILATRHRSPSPPAAPVADADLPSVTVQLPIFNERLVADRLVRAAAALAYPADRIEIQVLDDSTDETTAVVERAIAEVRRPGGPRIVHIRRASRDGFKAGALAHGLATARGDLVAVFDADAVPPPDFLRRAVAPFADARVGMVQARWGFLNEDASVLTRAQGMSLRAHFRIDHAARAAAGLLFNFNGTAGVWRRAAIDDAGGWQGDTLTEDLDLSYRAQLRGWRFVYLDSLVAPSELPPTFRAFKTQQHRWMKGTAQVARKILPAVLRSPLPLRAKVEAAAHLLAPAAYLGVLASFVAILPIALGAPVLPPFLLAAYRAGLLAVLGVVAGYHFAAERGAERWRGPADFAARFACLLVVGAGLAATGARAFVEGFLPRPTPFVRTPKYGAAAPHGPGVYRVAIDPWIAAEAALVFYAAAAVAAAPRAAPHALPWAALFLAGTAYAAGRQALETARGGGS